MRSAVKKKLDPAPHLSIIVKNADSKGGICSNVLLQRPRYVIKKVSLLRRDEMKQNLL